MHVARADDGDIFRHAQTGFEDRFHRARGHRIVIAEHAVGPGISLQQLAHGLITGAVAILAADDVFRADGHAAFGQRALIAFQPRRAGAVLRTPDVRYPLALLIDEIGRAHV